MVRHFPRARTRALTAALACAVVAAGVAIPGAQADDLKHKKHRVERQVTSAKADLEESSQAAYRARTALAAAGAQLRTAQQRLASTQGRLTAARALDRQMQAELDQAVATLARAQQELVKGRQRVQDQRDQLGRMAADNAQRVDPRVVGLVSMLNAEDPSDVAAEARAVGSIMSRQDRILDDYRQARTLLAAKAAQVRTAKEAVATKRRAAADNLALRERLEQRAQDDEQAVSELYGTRRQARRAAERARRADQAELGRLKKENDKIASMLAARAARSTDQGNSAGGGALLRPVTGYVTSPFGWRRHPIYGYWGLHDGVDFHAPCGTPLRAAGNGTVVSEYFQSAWGNRLILDLGRIRGHGVSVIYNHISAYKVGTGGHVSRGDTVAYAGTTGWSTACHLHFTVMVDGKAQDPMGWF